MHQLASSLMSLCLDTRLQCHAKTGLGLTITNQKVLNQKLSGLNQQMDAMLHANKQVLKLIKKSTQCNKDHTGGKELTIPIGNHVLLCDHPEGHKKIQDWYKSGVYVVVSHHEEPNVYYIQPLDTDNQGSPKVVNWHQLFDLNHSSPPSAADTSQEDDDSAVIPSFLHPKPKNSIPNSNQLIYHPYNTRNKHKAATACRQAGVNTIITHL